MGLKNLISIPWYFINKTITPAATLIGIDLTNYSTSTNTKIGAVIDSLKAPYELITQGDFINQLSTTITNLGENIADHPTETIATVLTAYIIGKAISYMSEEKRKRIFKIGEYKETEIKEETGYEERYNTIDEYVNNTY